VCVSKAPLFRRQVAFLECLEVLDIGMGRQLGTRAWNIPAARRKNGRAHQVPLSAAAMTILESLNRSENSTDLFEPVSYSREKAQLDAALPGMQPWVLHDLRRSAASGMASLGVSPHVVEAVFELQIRRHQGNRKARRPRKGGRLCCRSSGHSVVLSKAA
jgi:integrase